MKRLILLFIVIAIRQLTEMQSLAQAPSIQWQHCYGGTSYDRFSSICQTIDGGYILAGGSRSNDGDVSGNHGGYGDFWVVKISSFGVIQWQKCLGGTLGETVFSIQQTKDSGYIVVGATDSNDGDVSGNHSSPTYIDAWVVKLDSVGTLKWQKCYGGSYPDEATSVQQTADGGYIISGVTDSNDGDVSGIHGTDCGGGYPCPDYWVIKTDSAGNLQWQKCLGGTGEDFASSVIITRDNEYFLAGSSQSVNGDVSGNYGDYDIWLVKLKNSGTIDWSKCYGGSSSETIGAYADFATGNYSVCQMGDGGYVVAGLTASNDDDVSGNNGISDYWVIQIDSIGNLKHQKCLGGSLWDVGYSVSLANDGGFIVTGQSASNDSDVTGNHGGYDYWVVKLDSVFNIKWGKCLGGSSYEESTSEIIQTNDGGYILAGFTDSNDGDVSGNHGLEDGWVVKLGPDPLGISEPHQNIMDLAAFINNAGNLSLRFYARASEKMNVRVMDMMGRTIAEQMLFAIEGINHQQIKLPALAAGVYVVSLDGVAAKVVVPADN